VDKDDLNCRIPDKWNQFDRIKEKVIREIRRGKDINRYKTYTNP